MSQLDKLKEELGNVYFVHKNVVIFVICFFIFNVVLTGILLVLIGVKGGL